MNNEQNNLNGDSVRMMVLDVDFHPHEAVFVMKFNPEMMAQVQKLLIEWGEKNGTLVLFTPRQKL